MKILCMSHGPLAKGMVETTEFIVGKSNEIDYLCAYMDGSNDIDFMITNYLDQHNKESIIVITDIFGGSINNEWLKHLSKNDNIHLISGMNLSFIIELIMKTNSTFPIEEIIKDAMQTSKESFIYCNSITYDQVMDDF